MGEVKAWPIKPFISGERAGKPLHVGVNRIWVKKHWFAKPVEKFLISVTEPAVFILPLQGSVMADTPEERDFFLKFIQAGAKQLGYNPQVTHREID